MKSPTGRPLTEHGCTPPECAACLPDAGEEVEYDLNLGELFHCASDLGLFLEPMPPVRSVHWADEGQGESGVLWISLHGVNVHL